MNYKNEKRSSKRYYVSEYIDNDYLSDIRIEINAGRIYKPRITDISMNGLGYFLEEAEETGNVEELDYTDNCFINMHLKDKSILTEVKKIWSIIIDDSGTRTLKGGFAFSVMSPEDRLSLAEFLKLLRNKKK